MPPTKFLLVFLLSCGLYSGINAQSQDRYQASGDFQFASLTTTSPAPESADTHEALYTDRDNDLFYIDFEKIDVPLQKVVIRDGEGDIIVKEDVSGLPVNTIYEVDLNDQEPGQYRIELYTFSDQIRYRFPVEVLR